MRIVPRASRRGAAEAIVMSNNRFAIWMHLLKNQLQQFDTPVVCTIAIIWFAGIIHDMLQCFFVLQYLGVLYSTFKVSFQIYIQYAIAWATVLAWATQFYSFTLTTK